MLSRLSSSLLTSTRTLSPHARTFSAMSVPSTMRACSIQEQGELDVIQVRDVDVPRPGKGELLIKVEYAGKLGAWAFWIQERARRSASES